MEAGAEAGVEAGVEAGGRSWSTHMTSSIVPSLASLSLKDSYSTETMTLKTVLVIELFYFRNKFGHYKSILS